MAGKGRGRRTAEREETALLGARAKKSIVELVAAAAEIRGIDKQEVVINGATKEAYRIIGVAMKALRRHKEQQRRARAAAQRAKRKGTA